MPAHSRRSKTKDYFAYKTKEGSQRQLAKRFFVSLSFIRDLTRRYRETRPIEPKSHGGGAVAKL
jgi:transposase